MPQCNFIVVTGGVMSGLGKGILSSSIARLMKSCGYNVSQTKIDPYVNVDAGTLSPFEHGEVFVLDDGGECDLDFGHYERFLHESLPNSHSITTGRIFASVIEKERKGDYLGNTVQIVPHITNEIKKILKENAQGHDILIVEIGGTVGDIESLCFLEAVRQLKREEKVVNVHLTYFPVSGIDIKTKPTQHSVIELRRAGIVPDLIVGRCDQPLTEKTKKKIALFCDVPDNAVISDPTLDSTYKLPLHLAHEGVHSILQKKFGLDEKTPDLTEWKKFVDSLGAKKEVKVGIVGKYAKGDTYLSIKEALIHSGTAVGVKPKIVWIDAEHYTENDLKDIDAMITPGGFGNRGIEGKINGIKWAREHKLPWLGLCLGFQLAVVEFSRNVLGLKANSSEFDPKTPNPVIIPHWEARQDIMGGTMRLGAIDVELDKNSTTAKLYNSTKISERHRHRYGLNPKYRKAIEARGGRFTGVAPVDDTIEIFEIPGQFFVGVQFHPELKSRPLSPHPLFTGLLRSASQNS
jgi:CTP synthase